MIIDPEIIEATGCCEGSHQVQLVWDEEDVAWINRFCQTMAENLSRRQCFAGISVQEINDFFNKESLRWARLTCLVNGSEKFYHTRGTPCTLRRAIDHIDFSTGITAAAVDHFISVGHS